MVETADLLNMLNYWDRQAEYAQNSLDYANRQRQYLIGKLALTALEAPRLVLIQGECDGIIE